MIRLAREAMRTRFETALVGDDAARLRAAGEEALDEIARVESWLSAHRADSALFRVNALAARAAVAVDARLLALLAAAQDLAAATGGAFDLAIGALLDCWNHAGMAAGETGSIPSAEAIAAARAACGMERVVELDRERGMVRFAHPGVRLDPGAIGKGCALDRAVALLREAGVTDALIHCGTSSACALGRAPDGGAWRVAVRHPLPEHPPVAHAELRDASLSVSAGHGRSFTIAGRRYGHVIDPRSGWPVQGNLLAAVIHPSALASDALSTALLVLGRDGLATLTARYPEAGFLLMSEAGVDGTMVENVGQGFVCLNSGTGFSR